MNVYQNIRMYVLEVSLYSISPCHCVFFVFFESRLWHSSAQEITGPSIIKNIKHTSINMPMNMLTGHNTMKNTKH